MHRRTLAALLLAHLTACTSSSDDTGAASSEGTAGTTTTTTTPTTGTADTSTGEPPTTGDTGTTSTTSTTSPTGDTTTGGAAPYCNGWQTDEGEPYLVLHNKQLEPLTDGATLPLECGGQGLFMFALYAEFGGFMPTSDIVDFAVTADVEGFNNNPEGHFYNAAPVGYYVGCELLDGGPSGFVPIFPLDNLDDLTVLDGKPADIHVVMNTSEGSVTLDFSVVLSVQKDDSWAICGG